MNNKGIIGMMLNDKDMPKASRFSLSVKEYGMQDWGLNKKAWFFSIIASFAYPEKCNGLKLKKFHSAVPYETKSDAMLAGLRTFDAYQNRLSAKARWFDSSDS